MKKDQMKKNVGTRVQLVPTAIRLDQHGMPLPPIDDDWFVQSVSDDGVVISNPRTGHVTTLGEDHIHHWTSNPNRTQNGARYGFYVLNVQLYIQGNEVRVRPTRPGESLPVQVPEVAVKVVSLDYPSASGIQARLNAQGYTLGWARPDRVAGMIDLEGYEEVIEPAAQGRLAKFRARDGLVLLKRRGNPPAASSNFRIT